MGLSKALPRMLRVRFQHRQDFYCWFLWEESYATGEEDIAQKAFSSPENRWAHFYTSYIYIVLYIGIKRQVE